MISQDKVVGFINLDSCKVDAFSERDVTLVQTFANSAAVAIQNAKLFAAQREQFVREASILGLMRAAAASLDLDQVLYVILDQLTRLVKADSGSIQLLENDRLRVATAIGFDHKLFTTNGTIFIHDYPLNEQAITQQEAILIDDVTKDNRYVTVKGTEKTRSFLLIPLISKGESIGLITLDNSKPGFFTYRDVELVVAIADNASTAITNARLYQEALRASERRAVLHRISQEIIRFSQDVEQVYTAIHEAAGKLMPCDVFLIALQGQKTGEINFAYMVETGFRYKPEKVALSRGLTGEVLSTGHSIIWSDSDEINKHEVEHFGAPTHVQSVIGVPLKSGEKTIGIISTQSYDAYAYGSEEQALLEMLASHAVTAIENTRLYDETQRRLKELEVINHVSTSLRQAQSLEEMLPILLNETLQLVNTQHGSIWLYDHSSNLLKQLIAGGADANITHKAMHPNEGIIGNTFSTGRMYISPELKTDPLLLEKNRESITPGLGAVSIPIQSTAGPVGVLIVSIDSGRQITEEINLLLILAEITGNAIHRSQLYEQSQRQVRRLTTLRDIDAAIASSFDLRLTLSILMDQTLNHLVVDAVDIVLYHPDIQTLSFLVGNGFQTTSSTRPQMRIGEGLAGQVILRQQTLQVNDLQNAPETRNEILIKREGFITYVGVPLIMKGQIKGVFEVFQRAELSPTSEWMDFLHTLAGQAAIAIDNSHLFENLQRSNQELVQAYDTTLEGWARALELRDQETEGHTRRVTELTLRLAKYMGIRDSDLVDIRRGVLLHDIGKMGVPDNILKKTGRLSDTEWVEMRKHPVYAYNLLSPIEYLRDALDIPYCHHEHWDGSGYPRGLKGTQIPLSARIFSIVDIWDALLSDRPYRKAWPVPKVLAYMKEIAGKQVDPDILLVFLKMIKETDYETG
jgi:GAF domain-containing protein